MKRLIGACLLGMSGMTALAGAQKPEAVKVAVYMDRGSPRTPRDMQRVLSGDNRFLVRYLTAEDIQEGGLRSFDVLVQGGGDSRVQSAELKEKGRNAIRSFVREGGGYVGICAGAHFTVPVPGDRRKLGILNVRVVDNKHWARGNGNVKIKLTAEGQQELPGTQTEEKLEYHQGPLLMPGDRTDLPPVTVLASYETEIAKNGAPHGVMPGTAAIVSAPYGKGKVFVFGPHPEMTKGQEKMVEDALMWAAGRTADATAIGPQPGTLQQREPAVQVSSPIEPSSAP